MNVALPAIGTELEVGTDGLLGLVILVCASQPSVNVPAMSRSARPCWRISSAVSSSATTMPAAQRPRLVHVISNVIQRRVNTPTIARRTRSPTATTVAMPSGLYFQARRHSPSAV